MIYTLHHPRLMHGVRQNAKVSAGKFRCRVLEPGLVSYEDQDCGKALLTKETIDAHIRSFVGTPLILTRSRTGRPTYTHARVTEENAKALAVGWVTDVLYEPVDGWWYAVGTVHDEEAKKAIQDIGFVSCSYEVTDTAKGGDYHNIPYHEELTAFEGEHIAIVDNPRYERATIRLNSKTKTNKENTMFKWIKSKLAPSKSEQSKDNSVPDLPQDVALEIDGQEVAVEDTVAAYRKLNSKDGEDIDGTSEVEVDGERVSLNDLVTSYKANAKKKNAEDEEDESKKDNTDDKDVDDKKDNADDKDVDDKKDNEDSESDEMKEKKDAKKKNKANSAPARRVFKVNSSLGPVSRARANGVDIEVTGNPPDSREAQLKRGNDRYGPRAK